MIRLMQAAATVACVRLVTAMVPACHGAREELLAAGVLPPLAAAMGHVAAPATVRDAIERAVHTLVRYPVSDASIGHAAAPAATAVDQRYEALPPAEAGDHVSNHAGDRGQLMPDPQHPAAVALCRSTPVDSNWYVPTDNACVAAPHVMQQPSATTMPECHPHIILCCPPARFDCHAPLQARPRALLAWHTIVVRRRYSHFLRSARRCGYFVRCSFAPRVCWLCSPHHQQ
jgi:hypothetical protein